ncbi:unnamed protein product [Chrysodeixis includens]|uniref:Uncharacterized protein n=1 Tax=Chrysodeixis includens TaxID=689277 RepID=A0A9N8KT08_CHRIL|nr:unnamed protein product [Chrysodeixis includens]
MFCRLVHAHSCPASGTTSSNHKGSSIRSWREPEIVTLSVEARELMVMGCLLVAAHLELPAPEPFKQEHFMVVRGHVEQMSSSTLCVDCSPLFPFCPYPSFYPESILVI